MGFIDKYISLCKERSVSEADIASGIAFVYFSANVLDKAEEYYRQALSLDSLNTKRLTDLAYFLIDKEKNITEGLKLAERVTRSDPDNYVALHCEGWGYYKLGKYKEALDMLEKSWDLKPVYWPTLFLHLEETKKTLASLK